eukprot:748400-Hanusia_phi.AAC.9
MGLQGGPEQTRTSNPDESKSEFTNSYYDIDFGPSLEIPLEFNDEHESMSGLGNAVSDEVKQNCEVGQLNATTMDQILFSRAMHDNLGRAKENDHGARDEGDDLSTTTDASDHTPDKRSKFLEGLHAQEGRRTELQMAATPATVKQSKKSSRISHSPEKPHEADFQYHGLPTKLPRTPQRRNVVTHGTETDVNRARGRVESIELRCIVHVNYEEPLIFANVLTSDPGSGWILQGGRGFISDTYGLLCGRKFAKHKNFQVLHSSALCKLKFYQIGGKRFFLLDKPRMKNPDGRSLSKLLRLAGGVEVGEPSTAEEAANLIVLVNPETCSEADVNRMRALRAQLIKYGFVMDSISMFEVAEDYMQTYLLV